VAHTKETIALILDECRGQELDEHYLGFYECFNRQLYFEAHEVLEHLWLPQRGGPDGPFYKGLIQLAGAFVHVQKNRPGPATALLKLAASNLEKYPKIHVRLNISRILGLIADWRRTLETGAQINVSSGNGPVLHLEPALGGGGDIPALVSRSEVE
jgi:predicted metal-dependent hydrolase